MSFFDILQLGSSGLAAQRLRQEVISANIANVSTTRTPQGGPYVRKDVLFGTARVTCRFSDLLASQIDDGLRGVRVIKIIEDESPPIRRYEPDHPDADAQGYVSYPNINVIEEMVNMLEATRAYQANLNVINAAKSMALGAIDLGR